MSCLYLDGIVAEGGVGVWIVRKKMAAAERRFVIRVCEALGPTFIIHNTHYIVTNMFQGEGTVHSK